MRPIISYEGPLSSPQRIPSVTVQLIKPRRAAAGTRANGQLVSFYFLFISPASGQKRKRRHEFAMFALPRDISLRGWHVCFEPTPDINAGALT
jgi:hypothetical protein